MGKKPAKAVEKLIDKNKSKLPKKPVTAEDIVYKSIIDGVNGR